MTSPVTASLAAQTALPTQERAQLAEAAQKFEAIFLRQMLATARDSSIRSDLFSGNGTDTFRQLRDDAFADLASQQGVLGLASIIEAQLTRHMTQE